MSASRNFNEQQYCDITIITHNSSIRAHKAVICSASPVIDKALSGKFQEAQHDSYTINSEDNGVVWRFIQYCYLGQYSTVDLPSPFPFADSFLQDKGGIIHLLYHRLDTARGPVGDLMHSHITRIAQECNTQRLLLDIDMYRLGDIYDVPALRLNALAGFKIRLDALLLEEDDRAAEPFLDIIKPIYECTGREEDNLRKMLVLYLRLFSARLASEVARKRLGELAGEVKEFGSALVGDYLELVGRIGRTN